MSDICLQIILNILEDNSPRRIHKCSYFDVVQVCDIHILVCVSMCIT